MAKSSANDSPANVPAKPSVTDNGDGGSSPKLRGLDSNPQGAFGPRVWQAFRDSVAHIYDTVSLPDPSDEARFTLSSRTYANAGAARLAMWRSVITRVRFTVWRPTTRF